MMNPLCNLDMYIVANRLYGPEFNHMFEPWSTYKKHGIYSLTLYTTIIMAQVIVVGGGLAGLSAAHTLLERGANVLLLDKQGCVSFSQAVSSVIQFFFIDSWVVTPQKPHPVLTVLAQTLRRH